VGLKVYRKKRDFAATPEPSGRRKPRSKGRSFVIQKHAATRLHYDFRLEHDGVLVSWAVPKGPSLDPSEKRLAVHVEDHPLEYGGFEGVIPTGHYGGGPVLIWDRGTWTPHGDPGEGIEKGKLSFDLDGERLQGRWALVRMHGRRGNEDGDKHDNWLLMKSDDGAASREGDVTKDHLDSVKSARSMEEIEERPGRTGKSARKAATRRGKRATATIDRSALEGARRGALPHEVELQLATLVTSAPDGPEWIHEVKFDGYRIAALVEGGKARLLSRNNLDWTKRFRAIASEAAALPVESALLDGEVVALGEGGITSFQALQQSMKSRSDDILYYVFDLLHLDGWDLRGVALEQRKLLLEQLLARGSGDRLRYSAHVEGHGAEVHRQACERALEGIIAKRRDRPHVAARSRDWVKVKCMRLQELVIGGFTEPKGSRGGLGALLLGVYEDGKLRFSGKVGTGFSENLLRDLRARLEKLEQAKPPFADPPRGALARGVHWVKPQLVAQVHFLEWTSDGILRHPSFEGLREDKDPRQVVRERAAPPPKPARAPRGRVANAEPEAASGETLVAGVRITHPDRVMLPESGATKLDVARYYEAIERWVMPHLEQRPLTLMRCPDGLGAKCFFQKHRTPGMGEAVKSVRIRDTKGTSDYVMVDSIEGVVSLVQVGALELHVWGSRVDRLEQPDRVVFDLDPDPSVKWPAIVEAALGLRERLAALDLESFVKTTGGKGLHVVVPLRRGVDWTAVKAFSHAVAEALAAEAPDRFTASISKSRRGGRIFVDYLRNVRGATWVAPYSSRARDGGTVSTPLGWDELGKEDVRQSFTIETVPKRLARLRRDPWAGIGKTRQSLSATLLRSIAGR
jgi:bifunctional non-homologous end joining protein LigD